MDSRVDKLIEVVRKVVIRLFPELAGRYHLTAKAQVMSAKDLAVQPLTKEGSADTGTPAIKCPAVPVTLKPGNRVTFGFMYGDPSEPFLVPKSTGAIGTWATGKVTVPGYGTKDALVAEHLKDHFRLTTFTSPVDVEGVPLPGATTSDLTRINFMTSLKDGDQVVALPIEEGDRFIVVGKL